MDFPKIDACLVCELARPELGNKSILIGYYGITPYVRVQIQDFAQPVQLCFVFAAGPGDGRFRIGLRIIAPNGTTFDAPDLEGSLAPQATHSNIFMGFVGVLPGPGNYVVSLLVNGAPHFKAPFGLDTTVGVPVPAIPLSRTN